MNNELIYHSGVKGMRWGIRRYQNKDGSLTDTGKKRYDRDIKENLSKKKDNRIDTSKPDANRWVYKDANFDTNRKSLLRHISAEKGLK